MGRPQQCGRFHAADGARAAWAEPGGGSGGLVSEAGEAFLSLHASFKLPSIDSPLVVVSVSAFGGSAPEKFPIRQ